MDSIVPLRTMRLVEMETEYTVTNVDLVKCFSMYLYSFYGTDSCCQETSRTAGQNVFDPMEKICGIRGPQYDE